MIKSNWPSFLLSGATVPTIAQLLAGGESALLTSGSPSPRLDAEVLLAHILGRRRTHLLIHGEASITAEQYRAFLEALERRRRQEPVAYITGTREFWGLDFKVTPDVLIPRPETEHLLEQARECLARALPAGRPIRMLDLGTGSGCLAVALATENPQAQILATDISLAALRVAMENAERHGVSHHISFLQSDGFEGLRPPSAGFDLIVCNPPYIAQTEFEGLPLAVRAFEPRHALTDEADGHLFYRRLIPGAMTHLQPGGHLILELGAGQAAEIKTLFDEAGWEIPHLYKDLQGLDRCMVAQRRAP